jgi:hypothetical protein
MFNTRNATASAIIWVGHLRANRGGVRRREDSAKPLWLPDSIFTFPTEL